jgi:hypothetical protein
MYLIVILNPKKTKASAEERGFIWYYLSSVTGVTNHGPWVVILTDLKNMADCHE